MREQVALAICSRSVIPKRPERELIYQARVSGLEVKLLYTFLSIGFYKRVYEEKYRMQGWIECRDVIIKRERGRRALEAQAPFASLYYASGASPWKRSFQA